MWGQWWGWEEWEGGRTKCEPEEDRACFLGGTPPPETRSELVAFFFGVRIVIGVFASGLCPR